LSKVHKIGTLHQGNGFVTASNLPCPFFSLAAISSSLNLDVTLSPETVVVCPLMRGFLVQACLHHSDLLSLPPLGAADLSFPSPQGRIAVVCEPLGQKTPVFIQ